MKDISLYFPLSMRTGLFKTEQYILLASVSEVILVQISAKKNREILAAANNNAKSNSGYFNIIGAMFGALNDYGQQLATQPLSQILADHPGSIVIPSQDILKLRILQKDDPGNDEKTTCEINIKTTSAKYHGTLNPSVDIKAMSTALAGLMGDKFSRF